MNVQPETELHSFTLFDLAEEAAAEEADAWREDPGLNLFLEETIALIRSELESMPAVVSQRLRVAQERERIGAAKTEIDPAAEAADRPRIWVMCGALSYITPLFDHYREIAKVADIWLFGVPDIKPPTAVGLNFVALTAGSALAAERSVIVDSPLFGAALLAREAGQLDEEDAASLYCEGFLTARESVIHSAVERLHAVVGIDPPVHRTRDQDLTVSWQSRLNIRLLEHLEGQKLALRARTGELKTLLEENKRKEKLLRGYVGGATWQAIEETLERGGSVVNERRQELTICFCDLVGFTSLSERLHPSEVASFLNDHFAKLHDIVRAHAGWVDKFIGDAMLAIFDNPTEAMIAAQKMVRDVRLVQVNQAMEQKIQLRVGLNTGIVALASLGVPEKRELTVLGDAVNLAQRLQSAAAPNSVMLSSRTFSRLPFAISRVLEPLEISVKGKKDPVQCYVWSVHSDRRAPDKSIALRENLLTASRRTSLGNRLGRPGTKD